MVVHSKAKRIIYVGGVMIAPGVSIFKKVESEKLLRAKEQLLAIPTMSIVDKPEVEETHITSILDLNQKDAISLIKDTVDVKQLKQFIKEEETNPEKDRPKVFKAIEKQLKLVEDAGNAPDEDEEEEDEE